MSARPATAWYRLVKFGWRSRIALAASLAAVVIMATAAALALSRVQQANAAAARARAVREFVLDTFRVDAPGEAARLDMRRSPREYLLQRGAELIDQRFPRQAELQAELHGVVSTLFGEMGDFERAELHAARRLQVLGDNDAAAADKAAAAITLSQALLRLGRAHESEEQATRAVEWARGNRRLEFSARLQRVAALAAGARRDALREEVQRLDEVAGRDEGQTSIEHALALDAHAALASLEGDSERRVFYAQQAVSIATAAEGTTSRDVLNLRWSLWRTLIELRQVEEARMLGNAIVADLRQLGGPRDPTAAFAELYATAALFADDPAHGLAFDDAQAQMLADREIVKARGCRGIPEAAAWSDYFLGWLYASWHQFDRAEPLLRESLERIGSSDDAQSLIPYARRELAWTWLVRGEHGRAEAGLRQLLGDMARRDSALAPLARAQLAWSRSLQGQGAEALKLVGPSAPPAGDAIGLEAAVLRSAVLLGQGDAEAALAALPSDDALAALPGGDRGLRGEVLCATGRGADGAQSLARYVAAQAPSHSASSPFLARARAVEGLCDLALGRVVEARRLARESRAALVPAAALDPYFQQPLARLEGALATPVAAARARP